MIKSISKIYCTPDTRHALVRSEGCFCTSEVQTIESVTIEVEDWKTIENEVSFD